MTAISSKLVALNGGVAFPGFRWRARSCRGLRVAEGNIGQKDWTDGVTLVIALCTK